MTATPPPAAKPKATAAEMPIGQDVTYVPGEGDPVSVKWRGLEFKANTAVWVANSEMLDAALGNRFFRVGDR
jgi:hypothetical protein